MFVCENTKNNMATHMKMCWNFFNTFTQQEQSLRKSEENAKRDVQHEEFNKMFPLVKAEMERSMKHQMTMLNRLGRIFEKPVKKTTTKKSHEKTTTVKFNLK